MADRPQFLNNIHRPPVYLKWYTDYVDVMAVCQNKCKKKIRELLAYYWQRRPNCINATCLKGPTLYQGPESPEDAAKDSANDVADIVEGAMHAAQCGHLPNWQCFIERTPAKVGQKFCDKLNKDGTSGGS